MQPIDSIELSLENADIKQNNFAIELKNFEARSFQISQDYYLVQEKKFSQV